MTTLKQGGTYKLTVTGSYQNPHRIKAFIDYNNDGKFGTAELIMNIYSGIATKKITIPSVNVVTGTPLRMRIVADNPADPLPTACNLHGTADLGAGQAEDYTVVINPATLSATATFMNDAQSNTSRTHLKLYPNPSHNNIYVELYLKEKGSFTTVINDMNGKALLTKKIFGNAGYNFFQFNISTFAPGIYYANFSNGESIKFIKE